MTDDEERGGARGAPNLARVPADGPLCVTGRIRVEVGGEVLAETDDVALCRCGHSANKPFCDGSHERAGFEDPGVVQGGGLVGGRGDSSVGVEDGTVRLVCRRDGPVLVDGPLEVVAADGARVRGTKGALCRCGHSSTKPFCDGAHRRAGFEAT